MMCDEARLLLQAELDHELDAAGSAALAGHCAGCAECARDRTEMAALSRQLRSLPRHAAPARLHALLAPRPARRWLRPAAGFGAGFALAASLALALLPPRGEDLAGQLVAGHVHALQAGHLLDVASSDQHQVKPWFLGRLDYAPPVREPADYPLLGGRLDVLDGRAVAALVYRARQHSINLFVAPEGRLPQAAVTLRDGFHLRHWVAEGMVFWAVSDASPEELDGFERAWQAAR